MSFRKACAATLACALACASFSACRPPVSPDDDDDPVLSSDATLSSLVVRLPRSTTNILESFDPETLSYSLDPVVNATSAVVIEATARNSGASVEIPDSPLSVGNNSFSVSVTAADGVSTKTYTIGIERFGAEGTLLKSLGIDEVAGWTPDIQDFSHSVNIPNNTDTVTIRAAPELAGSTLKIRMSPSVVFSSFTGSIGVALVAGETKTVTIRVTSEFSQEYSDYTLRITRASDTASNDATLSGLSVVGSNGAAVQLAPSFDSGINNYTATVASTVSSLSVTPTATDDAAVISVAGADSLEIETVNNVTITVTAADATTTATYSIAVTRREYPIITISDPVQDEQIPAGSFTVTGTYADTANELESIVAMFGGATYTGTMAGNNFSININASGATNGSKSLIVLGYPETGSVPAAVAMTDVTIISGATGYNVSCSVVLPDNANTLASGYMTMCLVSGESLVEVDWDIDVRGITFPYRYTFQGIPAGSYSVIVEVVDDEFVNAMFVGESSTQTVLSGPRDFGSVYLTEYVPE